MLGHVVDVTRVCCKAVPCVVQRRFAIDAFHHFQIHIETLILEPIDIVKQMVQTQIVKYYDARMNLRDMPDGPVKTWVVSYVVKRHICAVEFSPGQPVKTITTHF